MLLQLKQFGDRPPLGPDGPGITDFGTPDRPDWRTPFVPAEHVPAVADLARTLSVLGHIAEALTVEPPKAFPAGSQLN